MQLVFASGLLGLLLGVVDCVATAATSPDPGSASYLASLLAAPVVVSIAWSIALGGMVGILASRRARAARGPALALRAVAALWLVGVTVDAGRAGHGAASIALLVAGAAVLVVGLVAFCSSATAWFGALGGWSRRGVVGAAGLLLVILAVPIVTAARGSVASAQAACEARAAAVGRRPNVLLLSIDTLRSDAAQRMGSYRRLARAGIEYTNHVTVAPWTLPSMATILTGLPPEEHRAGVTRDPAVLAATSPVAPGTPTLADAFRAAGYWTHAVATNPFLSPMYGIARGFCSFTNLSLTSEAVRALARSLPLRLARASLPAMLPTDRADSVRIHAERWLADHGDEPFFLWLHFLDPHSPYGDRDDAPTSIALELTAFGGRAGLATPFRDMARLRSGEYRPPAAERRRIEDLYLQDVAFVDHEIEQLLDFLQGRGLLDGTVVVLTSDHGEEFWEHGGAGHGASLYDEVLHVPLVIKPAVRSDVASPPVRVARQTSAIEVADMVLSLAGLRGEAPPGRSDDGERAVRIGHLLCGAEWQGVRTGSLKYMRAAHGEERLYDLERDPHELTNLISSRREQLARARALLDEPLAPLASLRPGLVR